MTNTIHSVRVKQESTTWVLLRMFLLQGLFLSAGLVLIVMMM